MQKNASIQCLAKVTKISKYTKITNVKQIKQYCKLAQPQQNNNTKCY